MQTGPARPSHDLPLGHSVVTARCSGKTLAKYARPCRSREYAYVSARAVSSLVTVRANYVAVAASQPVLTLAAKLGTMAAPPQRVQRMMTQPINILFRLLQHGTRVQLWLYDSVDMKIQGRIIGALPLITVPKCSDSLCCAHGR